MSEGKYFYVSERVIYEGYPQEGQHLCILRLRRELATMIDVDRPIDPLSTSCDAFAYTDKGVHLFWVAPKTPESATEALGLPDPLHVKLTNGQDYPLICQSKHRVIFSYTEKNGTTWPVSLPRQCSAVTQEGFELAAEYNRYASAFVEHDTQLFAEAVRRASKAL
jgi:hypothetical protein